MGLMQLAIGAYLNNRISSQRAEINTINEDIEKYRLAISDAKKAQELLIKAVDDLDGIIEDVSISFRGEAAPQFVLRVEKYQSKCEEKNRMMDRKIAYYQDCIEQLESRKRECQRAIEQLNDYLGYLRWLVLI